LILSLATYLFISHLLIINEHAQITPATREQHKPFRQLYHRFHFPHYLEQSIGKGTFGKVYRGLHRPTQQRVAIKILEKSRIDQPADFTRI
jgi:hypothetical protein